jgi:predicted acyltransferase
MHKVINLPQSATKSRNQALDIFRGLTIFFMIIVNSAGNGAPPFAILDHAEWFGFTLADLVFPSFLFAMGNSMAFVNFEAQSDLEFDNKIIRRTIYIFAIGLLLAWFPFFIFNKAGNFEWKYFENLRFMGVLQRIALCYFLASILIRYWAKNFVISAAFILLILYWALLYFGAPMGLQYDKAHNFGSVIDNLIIPHSHIYRRDNGFEPEGILGTIPATANVLAGYITAKFIQNSKDKCKSIKSLFVIGFFAIIIGITWGQFFPISKKLWSSSYVMLCNGLDILILTLIMIFYQKYKFGAKFFETFGKNPLVIYVFSIVLLKIMMTIQIEKGINLYYFLSAGLINKLIPGSIGSLVFAILIALICYVFAFYLDRKNIILKV